MKILYCIEKLTVGGMTFREGEGYVGNMVNDNYWVIDSVGVKTEDFHLHFEIQDEVYEKEDNITNEANKKFLEEESEFKEFLRTFGGFDDKEDENKEKDKETLWNKIMDYIFA